MASERGGWKAGDGRLQDRTTVAVVQKLRAVQSVVEQILYHAQRSEGDVVAIAGVFNHHLLKSLLDGKVIQNQNVSLVADDVMA